MEHIKYEIVLHHISKIPRRDREFKNSARSGVFWMNLEAFGNVAKRVLSESNLKLRRKRSK